MAKGLDEQMYEILGNYDKKVEKLLIKDCREVASDASEELQKTSPKKSGEYASGWVSKPLPKGAIVYNDTKPQLTHLLENGHGIKNQFGSYGRAHAHKHIKKAETKYAKELVERLVDEVGDVK